jgi:Leucine-rich repeat (LRR) protein
LIPYLSEAVKQNYGDIQHVTSEVDSVKKMLDALYDQFTGVKSSEKEVTMKGRSKRGKIFGWLAAVVAISALIALVIFYTAYQQSPNHTTLEILSPSNNERKMLIDLYNALRPDDTHPQWNFTTPHCSWAGISCNWSNRVIAITLPHFAFRTKSPGVPAIIGNFTELQVLDLHDNNISSTFPVAITRLTNLVSLNLGSNQFVGFVPDLRGLSRLKTLSLYENLLKGPLDTLLQLPALETIEMRNNPINSELPQTISKSLVELKITESGLRGTIPDTWATSNLTTVDLSKNILNGSVPCFGPTLNGSLNVAYNQLDGEFCGHALRSIQDLMLASNKLTGTFDLPGVKVSQMQSLRIDNNRFTSFMPSLPGDNIRGPKSCFAAYNCFKCPVPAWGAHRCDVTCQ